MRKYLACASATVALGFFLWSAYKAWYDSVTDIFFSFHLLPSIYTWFLWIFLYLPKILNIFPTRKYTIFKWEMAKITKTCTSASTSDGISKMPSIVDISHVRVVAFEAIAFFATLTFLVNWENQTKPCCDPTWTGETALTWTLSIVGLPIIQFLILNEYDSFMTRRVSRNNMKSAAHFDALTLPMVLVQCKIV